MLSEAPGARSPVSSGIDIVAAGPPPVLVLAGAPELPIRAVPAKRIRLV